MRKTSRHLILACLCSAVAQTLLPQGVESQDPRFRTLSPALRSELLARQQRVVVSDQEGVSRTIDPAVVDRLRAGESLLWKAADTTRTVSFQSDAGVLDAIQIPWEYRVARSGADADAEDGLIHAHPIIWADGPLSFDPDRRRFEGSLLVFLQDSIRPQSSEEVVPGLSMVFSTDADSLDRASVELSRTGFPPERIRLTARHPADSVQVEIRTPTDIGGFVVGVPVRPTVVIETPPRTVQGWGVGEFQVTVELHGPLPAEGVTLRPSVQGVVDSAGVFVAGERSTQLTIRSQGLGRVPLVVDAAGFEPDRVEFLYVFPYWFFGLGLLGSALGAGFATAKAGDRNKTGFFLNRMGIGVAGMLAYFVLGVQIFTIEAGPVPVSEVAALTVSLLAAFVAPNLKGLLAGRSEAEAEA